MRLADFISENRETILSEWVTFARTLLPAGRLASTVVLRDHAAGILEAIVHDMRSYQSAAKQAAKSQGHASPGRLGGAGKRHAATRLETGFRLDQLVAEYRALRASVLRLWAQEARYEVDPEEVSRFNEAIDETLAESTHRYMEMLDRHRDHFLGILGHDLRNPLGSIIMGASTLSAMEGLDDGSARLASRILHSASRMDRLVSDLLDLTRTRLGGGLPIVRRAIDLARVCRQAVAELHGAHPDTTLRFEARGDLRGEWDADRLAQVVSNLVGNAIQYGKEDRPVKLLARGERDQVVLEVHNEGRPIPQSALSSIFDPMVRVETDDAEKRSTRSLGLGLYVAAQVVRAHGGDISVRSTRAAGTTFSVHLPRKMRAAEADEGRYATRRGRSGKVPERSLTARFRYPSRAPRGASSR